MRAASLVLIACLGACSWGEPGPLDPAIARRIGEARSRLAEKPGDPGLLRDLGSAYADGGRLFDAADALQSAVEHGASDARTHAELADAYLRLGYVARAVDELRMCMTIDRTSPDCLFTLARLFDAEGSPEGLREGRRSLKQMLAIAPQHPKHAEAEKLLERIDAKIGPEAPGAEKAAASQPAIEPGIEPTIPEHAGAGFAESDEESASGEDGPAAETHGAPGPDMIPGHENKGDGSGEVGELNAFGLALQKAFAAAKAQDGPRAEAAFREALALRPKDPTALAGLAQALVAQSKKDEAMKAAEGALAVDPNDPQVRFTYGFIMFKYGKNFDRALKAWESLAKDEPAYAKQMGVTETLEKVRQGAKPR